MMQRAIRTNTNGSYSNLDDLNKLFEQGWFLVIVTPIGNYLEYIIQNNNI